MFNMHPASSCLPLQSQQGAAHTQEGPKARGLSTHLQARAKRALVGGGMLCIIDPLPLQGIEIAAPNDAHPWAVARRPSIYRNRDCCTAGPARWFEPRW
jgi:hypothetical protein